MKVKITKKTTTNNASSVDEYGVPYGRTAIRCYLHSDAEIARLASAIYELNSIYSKRGIIVSRSARYVGDDGELITDLMISYGNINAKDESRVWLYNLRAHSILNAGIKIDHEFINPKLINIEHNVDDVELMSTDHHMVIDRAILNNEFFESACKQLGFEDVDDIECIHIPLTKCYVTRKIHNPTIDTDGRRNIRDTKLKENDKKGDKLPSIMNFNIAIFDKENSEAFDKLIMGICNKAVIDITADYTEIDGGNFFRIVYMKITDDPAGRSLYTTACNYGCVNMIRDRA